MATSTMGGFHIESSKSGFDRRGLSMKRAVSRTDDSWPPAAARTVLDAVNDAILVHDADTGLLSYINPMACSVFACTPEQAYEHTIGDFVMGNAPGWLTKDSHTEAHTYQWVARRLDGTLFDAEASSNSISADGNTYCIVVVRDATALRASEASLRARLLEKETLLREVHHRVKNNLASVESLLNMQATDSNNVETVTALQNAMARVGGIRILYEKLTHNEGQGPLLVKDYVEPLVDSIVSIYESRPGIVVKTRVDEFYLDSKTLFSVGIIINELLTNVMKYAFTGRDAGEAYVSLTMNKQEMILVVKDNGAGLKPAETNKANNGFGLTLISMISKQLNGDFSVVSSNGTENVVRIPARSIARSPGSTNRQAAIN